MNIPSTSEVPMVISETPGTFFVSLAAENREEVDDQLNDLNSMPNITILDTRISNALSAFQVGETQGPIIQNLQTKQVQMQVIQMFMVLVKYRVGKNGVEQNNKKAS